MADRALVRVDVPRPPLGGAVALDLGGERRGWVASLPEPQQLPALAYGDDRVYVSGGFRSISFYALHATTGRAALGDDRPRGQRPDRGHLRGRSRDLQHRELHDLRARRAHRPAPLAALPRRSDAGPGRARRRPGVRRAPHPGRARAVRAPRHRRRARVERLDRQRGDRRPGDRRRLRLRLDARRADLPLHAADRQAPVVAPARGGDRAVDRRRRAVRDAPPRRASSR